MLPTTIYIVFYRANDSEHARMVFAFDHPSKADEYIRIACQSHPYTRDQLYWRSVDSWQD